MHPRDLIARVGSVQLGRLLGISRQAPYRWRRIPARHVPTLANVLGISRSELRPDLWDSDRGASRALARPGRRGGATDGG